MNQGAAWMRTLLLVTAFAPTICANGWLLYTMACSRSPESAGVTGAAMRPQGARTDRRARP
jgi:hypothetical protein